MSIQNLIIYKFNSLYEILEEISLELNYEIINIDNETLLNEKISNLTNFLIISNKNNLNIDNQIILNNGPLNISKLFEKINIEFLRIHFNSQSQVKINKYIIDLNSREIILNDLKLKLTEKEINTLIYLSKSDKPVGISELKMYGAIKQIWKPILLKLIFID